MAFFESRGAGEQRELQLRGEWRAASLGEIRAEQATLALDGVRSVTVDAGGAESLDLAGAWQLNKLLHELEDRGIQTRFAGKPPAVFKVVREALDEAERSPAMRHEPDESPVELIGRTAVKRVEAVRSGLAFVGEAIVREALSLRSWRRLRPISIVRHVWDTGVTAIPVVALIAFLISVIITYLSASQLRNYGAEIYAVDLITVGVLRELGVLLTAIIVAGRTGSAYAAEIGSMKLNEEVDALDATGVDPVEMLVLPRVVGLVLALPALTFIADVVGLAGGAVLCHWLLDMPLQQFINRANEAIAPTTFWAGMVKAPVFAILIALAGTYRGMQVRMSSRELGRLTTVAVVQSIFLVLLADAMFAVLFMELDF